MYEEPGASLVARMVKNPPAMQETLGSIPGSGRSPGEGHGSPLQDVFLPGESHGQRSLVATVHRVMQNLTRLKQLSKQPRVKSLLCTRHHPGGLSAHICSSAWLSPFYRREGEVIWYDAFILQLRTLQFREAQ